jgi:hypothetical protein
LKRAGSRKSVNAANLAALGAERLADLLMEAADEDPGLKRRLRMELAGEVGAEHLATEIAKRLATIEGRRSRIHWRKYRAFARDLEVQRGMIAGPLAEQDAKLALDMMWRFLGLASGIFGQTEDGRGQIAATFHAAVADTGAIAMRARPDPADLAERLIALIEDDAEQVLDDLPAATIPALDALGVAVLRARLETALAVQARPPAALRRAVQLTADAQGDVEGFIATIPPAEARQPPAGAEIARRLLKAGRREDALAALARSAPPTRGRTLLPGVQAWEDVFLDALEADGQTELAQETRWAAFEKRLATDRLRAFLKRLPDFDDVEAEDRAMVHARTYPVFSDALRFFTEWPATAEAAALVIARSNEIEPHRAEVLEPAAALLSARHPLAATVLLRAMIADTLRWARSDRYRDAERQLAEIGALAVQIGDWGALEPHDDFVARMARVRRL